MPTRNTFYLAMRSGHFTQTEFDLEELPNAAGFAMVVHCAMTNPVSQDTSHHDSYLWPGAALGTVVVKPIAYGWPSAQAAYAARDTWARAQQPEGAD